MSNFTADEYWKALVLYGLNQATYKIALGKVLLKLAHEGKTSVTWNDLADEFLSQYRIRLESTDMPQQNNPSRKTVMETIVSKVKAGLDYDSAVTEVGRKGFNEVIPRFDTLLGLDETKAMFYEFDFGKSILLKDSIHSLVEVKFDELNTELDARWGLLEGAFRIAHNHDYSLANEIREIYIRNATDRKPLTSVISFLQGYQANRCFYCGESLFEPIHVDHVLPRQVLMTDDLWNLVLSHQLCNLNKSDRLVSPYFIQKLIARNENIMGSNHPWKQKIANDIGVTPERRRKTVEWHYENVATVLGRNYWGGSEGFNPESDPFFKNLITRINNRC